MYTPTRKSTWINGIGGKEENDQWKTKESMNENRKNASAGAYGSYGNKGVHKMCCWLTDISKSINCKLGKHED
jgi:hypothetical protein